MKKVFKFGIVFILAITILVLIGVIVKNIEVKEIKEI